MRLAGRLAAWVLKKKELRDQNLLKKGLEEEKKGTILKS